MIPKVYATKGSDPYDNTRAVLSKMDISHFKNKKVLLKPNAGRIAKPGSGITTNAQVVAAAADAILENSAEVDIGESPIWGVKALETLEAAGITKIAEKRKCRLVDLDAGNFVKIAAPDGIAVQSFKVNKKLLDYDIVVSIPVMKMHMHTGVSLSIKNFKGCLYRRSKVKLHMLPPVEGDNEKPINIAIADMSGVLRPHLAIIDGSIGMEGLGPSAGEPKPLGVVIAGFDPFATDAVACKLMGISALEVPHLKIGAERGYGVIDINNIAVLPKCWKEWSSPFERPPQNLSIEFPNTVILDRNSCSACQSTLYLFLKRYHKNLQDIIKNEDIQFAIGKGHTNLSEKTICIGNCTASFGKRQHFIQGCPPVASAILCAVTGKSAIDLKDGHSKKF